jgi:GT2 family glycosyltransferase/glycosyltransferase involved in cell wall biosynthesis
LNALQRQHRALQMRWLFENALYYERYPELTEAVLKATGVGNLYEHYLWIGDPEGRSGSLFFDPARYQAELSPDDKRQSAAEGACAHFLRNAAGGKKTVRTSVYFDPVAYLTRYPEVAAAIAAGTWICALQHYLTNDKPTEFDPLPHFSERFYLARYPEVAKAIREGIYRNGYEHFLHHGVFELREACEQVDLDEYVRAHESVAEDIARGQARDAFAHYLAFEEPAGLAVCSQPVSLRTQAMPPVFARRKLDFAFPEPAALSVAMVTRDNFAATMLSLGALRTSYSGAIELLLVDAGSRDETRFIERFVTGAKLFRLTSDLGRVKVHNTVLTWASAPVILLLDNHVEAAPCAVEVALNRLGSDSTIGAVGGRVIDAQAQLRDAHGVRDDGSPQCPRDGSAFAPEANFVRDVDFCSELFLLVRTALLNVLGGFDEEVTDGTETVDLCRRIADAGYRVVYDPAIVAFDHLQRRCADARGSPTSGAARTARVRVRRILFIDDTVPLRMMGSGFVRSNDLIAVMVSLGFAVTVFPLDPPPFGPAAIAADMSDVVEVMYDRTCTDLEAFLRKRAGSFHAIWIARTHNLDRVRAALEAGLAGHEPQPTLVLDTEAVVALRLAGEATLHGRDFDLEAALAAEFRNAHLCRRLVAVSDADAGTLRGLGFDTVSVIGHLCEARPTPRPFFEREGLLFLGAIHEKGSPNYDGLCWFIDEVLPLIEQELGWETRLTVAGYLAPGVSLDRYRHHPRVTLRGAVAEAGMLYDSHRLFVAPARYAAGLPYKVHEAASLGLPVVVTEFLRAQLGWTDGDELLAVDPADAAAFARCIVLLYRDEALWHRLRDRALARIRSEHGREQYMEAVLRVLAAPVVRTAN